MNQTYIDIIIIIFMVYVYYRYIKELKDREYYEEIAIQETGLYIQQKIKIKALESRLNVVDNKKENNDG